LKTPETERLLWKLQKLPSDKRRGNRTYRAFGFADAGRRALIMRGLKARFDAWS